MRKYNNKGDRFSNRLGGSMLSRRRRGGRSRRGRRGRGRRGQGMHYVEVIPVSIELGKTIELKYSNLVNRPSSMNFRVQYVHFVGTTAYELGVGTTNPGFQAPSCIQINLVNAGEDTNGKIVPTIMASTGPVVLGVQPRNVKLFQPRQIDWLPYNQTTTFPFAQLSAVCIGSPGANIKGYVRGIVHVLVRFGPEVVSSACPALPALMDRLVESNIDLESFCQLDIE